METKHRQRKICGEWDEYSSTRKTIFLKALSVLARIDISTGLESGSIDSGHLWTFHSSSTHTATSSQSTHKAFPIHPRPPVSGLQIGNPHFRSANKSPLISASSPPLQSRQHTKIYPTQSLLPRILPNILRWLDGLWWHLPIKPADFPGACHILHALPCRAATVYSCSFTKYEHVSRQIGWRHATIYSINRTRPRRSLMPSA